MDQTTRRPHWPIFVSILWIVLMLAGDLTAQETTAAEAPSSQEPTRGQLQERLQEIQTALEVLRSETEPNPGSDPALAESVGLDETKSDLLERLRSLLEDRLDSLPSEAQETPEAAPQDSPPDDLWPSDPKALVEAFIGHPQPYTLLEYDRLLDRNQSAAKASELANEDRVFEKQTLERAEQTLKRHERERRRLEERLGEPNPNANLEQELGNTRLRVEIAELRQALQDQRATEAIHHLEHTLTVAERLKKAADWMVSHVAAAADDEAQHLETLNTELTDLRQTVRSLRRKLEDAETAADQASSEIKPQELSEPGALPRFNALQQDVEARSLEIKLIDDRVERLSDLRPVLQLRYRVWREDLDRPAIREAIKQTTRQISILERYTQRRRSELEQAIIDRRAIDSSLDVQVANQAAEAARWLRREQDSLQRKIQALQNALQTLNEEHRLLERVRDELADRVQRPSAGEQLAAFWEGLKNIWAFELVAVQDNPITVGKVLTSILLLIAGFAASRRLSRFLAQRLFARLGIDPSVVAALQTVTFYTALIGVFLLALWLVNIPLTVFTFLGGALAIGLGFGSQNIVNNFISGLILMIERPVKVGDLIEVDGLSGLVQKIGARSTHILSGDNTHLIIPNSSFLEGNVLNWTLSDPSRRSHVDIGVAYGSPTDQVKTLLLQAADDNEDILSQPAPEVLFMDFGDSALLFRLFFWTRIRRPADLLRRQSELRFHIDALCREADIEIPFPQRDLHLKTDPPPNSSPLTR